MVTKVFEQAFRRLVEAFKRHQDVPRFPENVADIGAARWDLELARNVMAHERAVVHARSQRQPSDKRKFAVSEVELTRLRLMAIGGVGRS